MTAFDAQYIRQCGKCWLCQKFTLPQNLTRDHLFPRVSGQRSANGGAYMLAHETCNRARGSFSVGSTRFQRWIKQVVNGRDPWEAAILIRRRRKLQEARRAWRDAIKTNTRLRNRTQFRDQHKPLETTNRKVKK